MFKLTGLKVGTALFYFFYTETERIIKPLKKHEILLFPENPKKVGEDIPSSTI